MSIWKSSTNNLVDKIAQWHHDRNLIEGSTDKDQYMKLIQEACGIVVTPAITTFVGNCWATG